MKNIFSNIKLKLAGLLLLIKLPGVSAQMSGQFDEEISYYRQIDTVEQIPDRPILFLGSSSVKNWYLFDSTFKELNCLNRGFGGSTIDDLIQYSSDVMLKYDPRQIVIYVGENDFGAPMLVKAEVVFERFQKLFNLIRTNYPEIPLIYLGIKPSPAKHDRLREIQNYNQLVKDFLLNQPNTVFIDIYSAMVSKDGKPQPEYFFDDLLHMNEKGYALWNSLILPYLIAE